MRRWIVCLALLLLFGCSPGHQGYRPSWFDPNDDPKNGGWNSGVGGYGDWNHRPRPH